MKVPLHRSDEYAPPDVTRVQAALINAGFVCARVQAVEVWRAYSSACLASWIPVDMTMSDAALVQLLTDYIVVIRS